MPEKVFVDTAAWIALVNQRDTLHLPARQVMEQLRLQKSRLVTTEFVLLEVADALSTSTLRYKTVNFVDSLLQLTQAPVLNIVPISRSLWLAGWELYKERLDKEWGREHLTFARIGQRLHSGRHNGDGAWS